MTAVYGRSITANVDHEITSLALALTSPSTELAIAPVHPHQCEYCAEADAITTVRVTGRPHPHVFEPIECEEVCIRCAPQVIERAVEELDPRDGRLVLVEVTD